MDNICFHTKVKKGVFLKLFCPPPPPLSQFLKVGRAIAPSSFAHEVVLVKFELQTHMEHLSSCQSGFLVVCACQSSVFWVFVIFCQPLNSCLFVMLYLYIYIIYCY